MPMTSRRAPKRDGTGTTLRVPPELVQAADRLAHELKISRNEALIRLALDGAARLDRAREIEAIRQARWAHLWPRTPAVVGLTLNIRASRRCERPYAPCGANWPASNRLPAGNSADVRPRRVPDRGGGALAPRSRLRACRDETCPAEQAADAGG